MKRCFFIFIAIFLTINISLFADDEIEAKTTINWSSGIINIDISALLPPQIDVLPEAKIQAQNKIDQAIPVIVQLAMESAIINSSTTVLDQLRKDLRLTSLIDNYSDEKYKVRSNLSSDFLKLFAYYQIPLYPDFSSTFIKHTRATPVKKILDYVPSKNYSGIIIYAAGELPIFSQKKSTTLNPCLFPRLLNEKGEIFFSVENVDPKVINKQGAVLYVNHLDNVQVSRVGLNPLKIQAVGIFGNNNTDLVLPNSYCDQILTRKNNRDLLTNGKIIIICDQDKIESKLYFTK